MKAVRCISLLLMVIGSLNWGLVGFFDFNLVDSLFGMMSMISRVIYGLVGLAGLVGIGMIYRKCCKSCGSSGGGCGGGCGCGCHKK